jgi:hypothetical protein
MQSHFLASPTTLNLLIIFNLIAWTKRFSYYSIHRSVDQALFVVQIVWGTKVSLSHPGVAESKFQINNLTLNFRNRLLCVSNIEMYLLFSMRWTMFSLPRHTLFLVCTLQFKIVLLLFCVNLRCFKMITMTHLSDSSHATISVSNLYSTHKLLTAKKILVPLCFIFLLAYCSLGRGTKQRIAYEYFPLTIYIVQLSHRFFTWLTAMLVLGL